MVYEEISPVERWEVENGAGECCTTVWYCTRRSAIRLSMDLHAVMQPLLVRCRFERWLRTGGYGGGAGVVTGFGEDSSRMETEGTDGEIRYMMCRSFFGWIT